MNKLELLVGVVHDIHFIAKFFFLFWFLVFMGFFFGSFFILLQNTLVHIQVITEMYLTKVVW